MKNAIKLISLIFLLTVTSSAFAQSNANSRYGETRFSELPLGAMVTKVPWVGSWWDYTRDGIAFRWQTKTAKGAWKKATDRFADTMTIDKKDLSPAEKMDHYLGRADKIDADKMKTYLDKVIELETDVNTKMDKRQLLVRTLNRLIEENSDNPSFNWKDTDEGKEYLQLNEEIEDATQPLDEIKSGWQLDTATEFEIMEHGNGQFNVDSWWGHCNAWAAAAIMEPEPRFSTTANGIEFLAGDLKGLLTEVWMECNSSFYGSRNDYAGDEESRDRVNYKDTTPAAFHIFFSDQLGNRDKSFVIDRHTGDEVWNQPVAAFRSWVEPLYETNEEGEAVPVSTEVMITKYNYQGVGKVKELGSQDVYPIKVKSTMWWMTDGVPHDELTVENINNSLTDTEFMDNWAVQNLYKNQVHQRTLNYVLWLTAPLNDENARVVGDGTWEHGSSSGYSQLHPDFMWQPTGNTNNSGRTYENEFIDYDVLVNEILPGAISAHEAPAPTDASTGTMFSATDVPVEIPDNAPDSPALSSIEITGDIDVHNLAVHLDIEHSYIGDLSIVLFAPGGDDAADAGNNMGCEVRSSPGCDGCSCQACVCEADDFCCGTAWDNLCVTSCMNDCGGCAGGGSKSVQIKKKGAGGNKKNIKKAFDVKEFDGNSATGTWQLKVTDHANQDEGRILGWSIEFN